MATGQASTGWQAGQSCSQASGEGRETAGPSKGGPVKCGGCRGPALTPPPRLQEPRGVRRASSRRRPPPCWPCPVHETDMESADRWRGRARDAGVSTGRLLSPSRPGASSSAAWPSLAPARPTLSWPPSPSGSSAAAHQSIVVVMALLAHHLSCPQAGPTSLATPRAPGPRAS